MKKLIFSSLFLCFFSMSCASAQNVESLFDTFKDAKNVTYVNVPKAMIGMAMKATKDKTATLVLSKIDHVSILDLDEAEAKDRNRFLEMVKKMPFKGYETMVSNNDGNDKTRILVKATDEAIHEVVIINTDNDQCTLVCVKGNFKPADIEALTNQVQH